VFEALASPGASVETKLVPRLGAAIAHVSDPVVLVLDDVHAITNPACLDVIVALAGHLAEGARILADPVAALGPQPAAFGLPVVGDDFESLRWFWLPDEVRERVGRPAV
jgi:anti-sigma factor ChrR (cupin superfamily)